MSDASGPLSPDRPDVDRSFEVDAPFEPAGDQPDAIAELVAGYERGLDKQTLLGVTGSGKTNTVSWVVEELDRPTLVIAHNKTLAAQLYEEFRNLFPNNAVEYFVSYYDIQQLVILSYGLFTTTWPVTTTTNGTFFRTSSNVSKRR